MQLFFIMCRCWEAFPFWGAGSWLLFTPSRAVNSNLETSLISLHLISKLHDKRSVRHRSDFDSASSLRNSTTDGFGKVSALNK